MGLPTPPVATARTTASALATTPVPRALHGRSDCARAVKAPAQGATTPDPCDNALTADPEAGPNTCSGPDSDPDPGSDADIADTLASVADALAVFDALDDRPPAVDLAPAAPRPLAAVARAPTLPTAAAASQARAPRPTAARPCGTGDRVGPSAPDRGPPGRASGSAPHGPTLSLDPSPTDPDTDADSDADFDADRDPDTAAILASVADALAAFDALDDYLPAVDPTATALSAAPGPGSRDPAPGLTNKVPPRGPDAPADTAPPGPAPPPPRPRRARRGGLHSHFAPRLPPPREEA